MNRFLPKGNFRFTNFIVNNYLPVLKSFFIIWNVKHIIIYINNCTVRVFLCLSVPNKTYVLAYHLLLCHDFLSLSSNFYHQGKKTTNSITFFCVMITQVLVQTFNTRTTLLVSQLEHGGTLCHWRSNANILFLDQQ